MKNKNLIVLESIHLKPIPAPETNLITTGELGQWVRSGKLLTQLFRYKEVCLLASQCHLLNRPFLCAFTLRLLCNGKCFFKDIHGTIQPITFITLCGFFIVFIRDFIRVPFNLRHHQKAVRNLESSLLTKGTAPLNLKYPPLYLRTDLTQGLLAGGSISHTIGIVNNLHHFASAPVVLTTVHVPNLQSNALHEVEPNNNNRNFTDILLLESNKLIFQQCRDRYAGSSFSFIYHRYSPYNYSGVALARHFRIPLIIEYNGPEAWVGQYWTKCLKYEQLAERIEIFISKAADVVVVVSQPLKSQLVERGVESEKILVNPNGVDPDLYFPDMESSNIRDQFNLGSKTVVGFIGTFGKWHGAEVLARAYGLLLKTYPEYRKTTQLLMVGDGVTMPQVKNEIEFFRIADNVILTGMVPQEEGPEHLAACDILVSPHVPNSDGTPFFGSPTKLFEYMAMGKGIVASDLDQIGEVLQHDHTARLVKPGDAESLMHGLKSLIDNPETRKRLGEAARREVVAKYTWKEHTRKIIEKLKERCPCD